VISPGIEAFVSVLVVSTIVWIRGRSKYASWIFWRRAEERHVFTISPSILASPWAMTGMAASESHDHFPVASLLLLPSLPFPSLPFPSLPFFWLRESVDTVTSHHLPLRPYFPLLASAESLLQ
jgi:hypothetical protein